MTLVAGPSDAEQRQPVVLRPGQWAILPNLTFNAGIRWEKEKIRGLNQIVYINVNHFSPRVGLSWDPMSDGKTKVSGSYSHFVPMIPLDMNIRSLNAERDGATYNFSPTDLNCDHSGAITARSTTNA